MMNDSYPAKAVVITGASTGIGEACALRLDNRGVRVFAGVRNESDSATLRQKASDSWRVELRPWGISVALAEPGVVDTPLREKTIATLRKTREAYPPEAREPYGPIFGLSERHDRRGVPAGRVARAVEHALFVRRPRHRYLVGPEAKIASVFRKLPVAFRDWLIAKSFPKYGWPGDAHLGGLEE